MKIILNVKCEVELKEKTVAYEEFGKYFPCVIKELEPVWIEKEVREFFGGRSNLQVLIVEDSYGEVFRIPLEDVERVRYK